MARKRSTADASTSADRPVLLVPRSDAEALIDRQQTAGRHHEAAASDVRTAEAAFEWNRGYKRWRELTAEALRTIYSTEPPVKEFESASRPIRLISDNEVGDFRRGVTAIGEALSKLQSLKDRLEFVSVASGVADAGAGSDALSPANAHAAKVFIVHGRDERLKAQVARVLERAGSDHEVLILHEQPSQGRTTIEKFEDYATSADHAVVLLTADDVGGLNEGEVELKPRARQNVVLELGFFVGHLGRSHVTVLYEEGVELPSDYLGVLYVPVDAPGAWQFAMVKELRAAGLSYDLNSLA